MSEQKVMKGEVIWFNDKLNFGFIKPEDGGDDMFAHFSNIVGESGKFKTLIKGQIVSYTVGQNNRGPQAETIVILEEPEQQQK